MLPDFYEKLKKNVEGSIKQIQKKSQSNTTETEIFGDSSIKLNQFDLVQDRCINLDTLYFLSINKIIMTTDSSKKLVLFICNQETFYTFINQSSF